MNMQKLRAQIAALQDATMDEDKNFRTAYDEGKFDAFSAVDTLLDSLQEEPVSEDLEEAANQYPSVIRTISPQLESELENAFKAGAQWQKEKMIDKTCERLKSYRQDTPDGTGYIAGIVNDKTIEEFRKAMEE